MNPFYFFRNRFRSIKWPVSLSLHSACVMNSDSTRRRRRTGHRSGTKHERESKVRSIQPRTNGENVQIEHIERTIHAQLYGDRTLSQMLEETHAIGRSISTALSVIIYRSVEHRSIHVRLTQKGFAKGRLCRADVIELSTATREDVDQIG